MSTIQDSNVPYYLATGLIIIFMDLQHNWLYLLIDNVQLNQHHVRVIHNLFWHALVIQFNIV